MIASEPSSLTLALFGPMQVQVEGRPLPRLRSRKALWLLALLTLRHGRPVEREWLAGTLWPDVEASRAASNLRVVLSELRQSLGGAGGRLLSPGRHTLSLDLAGADVDVAEFDRAITGRDPQTLARAVALYTGPLLEGCAEEWVGQERLVRERQCLEALATLTDAAVKAGDVAAVGYSRRAVALDPWRESAQRGLMQALSQNGDGNAALDVYREFVALLRKDDPRAVPDAQTTALYAHLRTTARQRVSTPPVGENVPAPVVTGLLPHPLTDLVGREDERDTVAALLRRFRLVTLTGPGGIGKTRLAAAVAAEAVAQYPDGAWLVALEALADGAQVPAQVAGVLGVTEEQGRTLTEGLTEHLRKKHLLLILDNCEHLLDAAAHLTGALLRECAGLRVLTTSREPLKITGETAWAVPPLSVPDPAHLPTGRATLLRVLPGYEAVQLFVERAQGAQKTFALTAENALDVAQVCARLEGIPLAIELAAAWVRALTVGQIAARLDDHLSLLTGGSRGGLPRQQTLRAALDWSYALLDDRERLLLVRLSVFAGGWTLAAAEGICCGEGIEVDRMLDLIRALVDKSLVIFDAEGERYRLLETVRQYAAERLQTSGATERMQALRRDWFATFAVDAYAGLRGADQVAGLRRLERERENFRAALTWIGTDAAGVASSLRMAAALWWFWYVRGYLSEGRQMLDGVLRRDEAQEPTPVRGRALVGAGTLAAVSGDGEAAQTFLEESLSIFRAGGKPENVASVLGNLGNVAVFRGDYELARDRYTESLAITREKGEPQPTAASLGNLAHVALALSDYAASWELSTEALGIFRGLGDKQGIARTLDGLADVAFHQDDLGQSQALYEEALALFRELQEPRGICDALSGLGNLAAERGDFDTALTLYRESLLLRREIGLQGNAEASLREFAGLLWRRREPRQAALLWSAAARWRATFGSGLRSPTQRLLDRDMAEARAALGETLFAATWTEGQTLTWEQAADAALATSAQG